MPYWRDTWMSLISACATGTVAHDSTAAAKVNPDVMLPKARLRAVIVVSSSLVGWRFRKAVSRAFIKPRHDEFAVAERLGGGKSAVHGAEHHVEELVARLVHRHLALQQAARVEIDVLAHRAHRARIRAQLDDRQDRIADDVALPRREEVDDEAGGGAQRHHFGGCRRAVHEPQAGVRRHFGLVENAVDDALAA